MFGIKSRSKPDLAGQLQGIDWVQSYITQYRALGGAIQAPCLKRRKELLIQRRSQVAYVLILARLGAEPGQPPTGWFCGLMEPGETGRAFDEAAQACGLQFRSGGHVDSGTFIGHVPAQVVTTYTEVLKAIPRARRAMLVAAPDRTLFEVNVLATVDPALFIYLHALELWLRVAIWDLDEDLQLQFQEAARD